MRKVKQYLCIWMLIPICIGCGKVENNTKIIQDNAVEKVLEYGVQQDEESQTDVTFSVEEVTEQEESEETESMTEYEIPEQGQEVDIDLTQMTSDMIYATVYQFMLYPKDYIGMSIRVKGNYYDTWYEATRKYYHYVVIQDATACCAQGMEFVWEDGSHVYPDEYPNADEEITVVGTFETYQEQNDPNIYCRLNHAIIE